MAHKTLIGGTQYGIKGGTTLVSGTSYSVKKGKTLIGGTGYDISFSLPPTTIGLWNGEYEGNISQLCYANGYWVALGEYNNGSSDAGSLMLAYTSDLSKGFTTVSLSINARTYNAAGIVYADGYWAIAYSDSSYTYIKYSTSLTGTWSSVKLPYSCGGNCNGIYYANGYWVVYGHYSTRAVVAYANSLTGTWARMDVWETNSSDYDVEVRSVTYANGYWVAAGYTTSSKNTYCKLAYATSIDGTWTNTTIHTSTGSSTQYGIYNVKYANGYWVCASYGTLLYSTSLTSTWTSQSVLGSTTTHHAIIYENGDWILVGGKSVNNGYAKIAYSTALDGTWTVLEKWNSDIVLASEVVDVVYGDEYYFFGVNVRDNDGTGVLYKAYIAYAANPIDFNDF